MLLSTMQKGHFPFKKGTFSRHFKSLGGGARAPSAPSFPMPLLLVAKNRLQIAIIWRETHVSSHMFSGLYRFQALCVDDLNLIATAQQQLNSEIKIYCKSH